MQTRVRPQGDFVVEREVEDEPIAVVDNDRTVQRKAPI